MTLLVAAICCDSSGWRWRMWRWRMQFWLKL